MKTKLFALALLLTSAASFAQTTADEASEYRAAVQKVLETETRAYQEANGDRLTAQRAGWLDGRVFGYTGNGVK